MCVGSSFRAAYLFQHRLAGGLDAAVGFRTVHLRDDGNGRQVA